MYYKLSNTAKRQAIEKEFNVVFEFPNLFKPMPIINGLEESTLAIVTMNEPEKVNYAIWGLMPENLQDNWKVFQNLTNTLNINVEHLDLKDDLYLEAMDKRRCLVIVTGFFTSVLYEGKIFPYYVYLPDHKPFAIAGVYNQLEDGFLTCSILIKKTEESFLNIPNLLHYKPVTFINKDYEHWLNKNFSFEDLIDLVELHNPIKYKSHPVSKDFYDNDVYLNNLIQNNDFKDVLGDNEHSRLLS